MAFSSGDVSRRSRRTFLKHLGVSPFLLRPASFSGALLSFGAQLPSATMAFAEARYTPHYPARSPLEDVLRLVPAGSDSYVSEKHASEIEAVFGRWSECFQSGNLDGIGPSLAPEVQAASFASAHETKLRSGYGVESLRLGFAEQLHPGTDRLLHDLRNWLGRDFEVLSADFQITSLQESGAVPGSVHTCIRYSLVLRRETTERQQRVGTWLMDWVRHAGTDSHAWQVSRWLAGTETRSTVTGPGFVDVTAQALGDVPSYPAQMLYGADEWRSVLDGACGIDVYGNNGIAAGDYDGDGFDDIYVCQTAGLPNRLYRNKHDGTFEDVTEKAGVGVLDNTACALFADFRNIGRQDLLVVCNSGPLLFQNMGNGSFALKRDAFQFAHPPQGTFTHAAIADYDNDGRLDIYFCLYSYYLGLDQYHYPAPYFDARNGPPNFLMHNQGDGTFADRTESTGLNAENNRYSFSCAWGYAGATQTPDLYVVNDFGRNNYYRSNGDGTFRAESTKAHLEDVGAGMSAAWADYDNDGRPDLYVANMWSAAGQRVSQQAQFHGNAPAEIRGLYRQHAAGNSLYQNRGDGTFDNRSQQAAADMGRWAWCSDFLDIDHDGYADLYIANGYITAPAPEPAKTQDLPVNRPGEPDANATPDLSSFFWRQIVAKSSEDATPSLAYERGWNALNELIRSGHSWSGHERNVLLANNRDGSFSEVSGALGMDFLEDSRSFALADLDGDGRLEIVLKNRNAPQLRILRNALEHLGDSVAFRLRGTKSNRDAIGTAVTVQAGGLRQTRYVQAGSGFLAQHSNDLLFGIGQGTGEVSATVRWPSGMVQRFDHLPRNKRIELVEAKASFSVTSFAAVPAAYTKPLPVARSQQASPLPRETWLLESLRPPEFSLLDLSGRSHTLKEKQGRPLLLHFWSTRNKECLDQLRLLQGGRVAFSAEVLDILLININALPDRDEARAVAERERLSFPVLLASDDVAGTFNIVFRYLFDRRADLVLPTTFLLDRDGLIAKVYQGIVQVNSLIRDARTIPDTAAGRVKQALPFEGTLHHGTFTRNDFTYGIAMFQHGYLNQAAESFQQVIAKHPGDAEAHYNLGTLNLRRNDRTEARRYLEQAARLKPDYPEAWNNLGMIAAQEGRSSEAIQDFEQSLNLRPNYVTALLNLGNVYRRQRAFAKAQELLAQAVSLQPDDPEANYSLGMLHAQQNQIGPATEYLQRAEALRPDYPEALNNLGVIFVREQEYAKAEDQFQTCIRLVPDFDESYINLARLYALRHEESKATTALEDLLRIKPESVAAKQALQALKSTP